MAATIFLCAGLPGASWTDPLRVDKSCTNPTDWLVALLPNRGLCVAVFLLFLSFADFSSEQSYITSCKKRNHTRDKCQTESLAHYLLILLISSPPFFKHGKNSTENKRIKITLCSSIPSHTKPLLLSWIVSSTLMTIQYSLQAADERPIHSSICCRPKSPDASLVRGPLQANWKTEAITQRQCLCVYVCVCWEGDFTERMVKEKRKVKKIIDNGWSERGIGNEEENERHSSSRKEQLTCQHLVSCGHLEKAPAGIELTQHKPTLCNESGPVIFSYYKYVFALYKLRCLCIIYKPLVNG